MSYLVDSDILIDAIRNQSDPAVQLLKDLNPDGVAVSIVSLGEIYEGAFGRPSSHESQKLGELRAYLYTFEVVNLNDRIMERFARLRSNLRRRGQLIPDLDLLIASTALQYELTLVTRNFRHFRRIPGLTLYIDGSIDLA